MKYLTHQEIRKIWLSYFASLDHLIEPSASLVPKDDKTLLWINAGITPLKKYFDGSVIPPHRRITNIQKCIRTNDIENVGVTARHHTFFEMMGNFSIGDYFKDEVVPWAYTLLTDERYFGIPKERLYMTIYPNDLKAKELWLKCGVDISHIIPVEGNFWEIGEGPSGPDTEIFFDRGIKYGDIGPDVIANDIENDRYVEIWNIVFSQYNAKSNQKREEYAELPSKNIDTGAGLERFCMVFQEAKNNYETDLFRPLITKIEEISGIRYDDQISFKVISDHLRTIIFALADGANFSNLGRGYVLRRLLRRCIKHARGMHITEPFMAKLVEPLCELMEEIYPNLSEKQKLIKQNLTLEEMKFLKTIAKGENRIQNLIKEKGEITASDAFILYDTYGFPIELTIEYATDANIMVDLEGFNLKMAAQKNLARQARRVENSFNIQNEEYLNFTQKDNFVGYEIFDLESIVIGSFKHGVVLDNTPLYITSGGQISDQGFIDAHNIKELVKLPNGQILHVIKDNHYKVGDKVKVRLDLKRRNKIAKNHSATHLLHQSLKDVLGAHVAQQGSLVTDQYLRFDFNHTTLPTDDELLHVESLVKEKIEAALPVVIKSLTLDEAIKLGAMHYFADKYGSVVRMVDMTYSKELCGGTHVCNTKEIGEFSIVTCESIGLGLYRITALTSNKYLPKYLGNLRLEVQKLDLKKEKIMESYLENNFEKPQDNIISQIKNSGYITILKWRENILSLKQDIKNLSKQLEDRITKKNLSDLDSYKKLIVNQKLITEIPNLDGGALKQLALALYDKYKCPLIFLISNSNDNLRYVCKTDGINYDAQLIIKRVNELAEGSGGGKRDLTLGGGTKITKLNDIITVIKEEF